MKLQRFREAEETLWAEVAAQPTEHRVHLTTNDVTVRIQEVGSGPAALFIHGGPGASGSIFAQLAARLPDLRCLLLDRPGTGLSGHRQTLGPAAVREESATLVTDVLDALGLESAHLVGSSHGSHVALLSAATHPDRVDRSVHLGCPGFIDQMVLTPTDRLVLLPGARQLFGLFRPSMKGLHQVMRQLGHGAALEQGRLSPAFLEWALSVQRDTDTMRNELATMAAMGSFRRGFDPTLTIDRATLGRVHSSTRFLWGTGDPYGGESVARNAVAAMPDASLEMLSGAGHLCWLDDVGRAAAVVREHLLGPTDPLTTTSDREPGTTGRQPPSAHT